MIRLKKKKEIKQRIKMKWNDNKNNKWKWADNSIGHLGAKSLSESLKTNTTLIILFLNSDDKIRK